MDTARGQRRQPAVERIDDLDGDVVAMDQAAEPLGDAVEDRPTIERRQDRFGDLEELALAAQLLLERRGLCAERAVASAFAMACAAKLA